VKLLWLSFPGPITGSFVGSDRVLSIALALLSPVAAINYPCCGGSPSKGNGINRFCDWLLGRLCSRWLRLHSCRCHQLSLLWRLAFQGKCRFQLPCLALLSAVLTLAALLLAPPPSAAFAVAAHLPRVMSFAPALVSPTLLWGGSGSTSIVSSACDWRLGRLCSRWLRLHSCRRHQLFLLWRLAFQGQCCHQCL
jgi:hypothetical protein